jgi:hypothetical protein
MILLLIGAAAGAFLYWKGWMQFTYTGVTKPLIGLSIFGVSVTIKKPDAQ